MAVKNNQKAHAGRLTQKKSKKEITKSGETWLCVCVQNLYGIQGDTHTLWSSLLLTGRAWLIGIFYTPVPHSPSLCKALKKEEEEDGKASPLLFFFLWPLGVDYKSFSSQLLIDYQYFFFINIRAYTMEKARENGKKTFSSSPSWKGKRTAMDFYY